MVEAPSPRQLEIDLKLRLDGRQEPLDQGPKKSDVLTVVGETLLSH